MILTCKYASLSGSYDAHYEAEHKKLKSAFIPDWLVIRDMLMG